ncbi:MAG TPA: NF038130 family PEP-CTERM protein [Leptolyngbyaceae cyanobacterium]
MARFMKKFLLGASVVASVSAIASTPVLAATMRATNIQFDTDNINTWTYGPGAPVYDSTGIGGVKRRVLNDFNNKGNYEKAKAALTDEYSATNVEIWTNGEEVTANKGFSANFGKNTIKVESVTKADWASSDLAEKWLNGFLGAYSSILQPLGLTPTAQQKTDIVNKIKEKGMYSSGDPNIGDLTLDDQTGKLKVDLVGHLDRASLYATKKNGVYVPKNDPRYDTGNKLLNDALFAVAAASMKQSKYFQVSEVAKVTFNGVVDYAFSFFATDAMAIAGDRGKGDTTSHTGIYTWEKTVAMEVPEPSAMLALLGLGGLAATKRKQWKKA